MSLYVKTRLGYYCKSESTCFTRHLLVHYFILGMYSSVPVEVPLNHKRSVCDLTQTDRLALYDFVIEETKKKRSGPQVIENDSDLFVDLAAKVNQGLGYISSFTFLSLHLMHVSKVGSLLCHLGRAGVKWLCVILFISYALMLLRRTFYSDF
jgi:hypothetical protein